MAFQWSGRIAGISDHFRGISTVGIGQRALDTFPNARAISDAIYVARVQGGVSGSFGITVLGRVGMQNTAFGIDLTGTTVAIAGITAISAAGTYILFPYGYSASGVGTLGDAADIIQRIDRIVPPVAVAFQSGIATSGISAWSVVNACIKLV